MTDPVPLSRSFEVFGKPVTEVRLVKPTATSILTIGGPPFIWIYPDSAAPFREPLWDKLGKYLDICILDDTGKPNQAFAAGLKAQLEWEDLDLLREKIFDFFPLRLRTAAVA